MKRVKLIVYISESRDIKRRLLQFLVLDPVYALAVILSDMPPTSVQIFSLVISANITRPRYLSLLYVVLFPGSLINRQVTNICGIDIWHSRSFARRQLQISVQSHFLSSRFSAKEQFQETKLGYGSGSKTRNSNSVTLGWHRRLTSLQHLRAICSHLSCDFF